MEAIPRRQEGNSRGWSRPCNRFVVMNSLRFLSSAFCSLGLALALSACGPVELDEIDPVTGLTLSESAATIDMNNLMGDSDIFGGAWVTAAKAQAFLTKRGGLLKSYRDPAFGNRTAADIIVSEARAQGVNPIYMMARIQTESSLISSGSASNIGKATGCGCPDGGGCGTKYQGFGKQIQCAALLMKNYYNDLNAGRPTVSGWKAGVAKRTSDPCTVTPANKSTAALYTYTPWVGAYARQCGNKTVGGSSLVAAIYQSYKADTTLAP